MPPVGFEPTVSAGERPQTYALDGAASGTSVMILLSIFKQEGQCTYDVTRRVRETIVAVEKQEVLHI
jgi:hypothetical protein